MTDTASSNLLLVDVQNAISEESDSDESEPGEPPSSAQLSRWAQSAYAAVRSTPAELTLRLCDVAEIRQLNQAFRGKDGSTNVLSFPCELDFNMPGLADHELDCPLLGDVVICHSVVVAEATEQGKLVDHHYAHMVTHGVLHLCGYDHQDEPSAHEMESIETKILATQSIADPYQ